MLHKNSRYFLVVGAALLYLLGYAEAASLAKNTTSLSGPITPLSFVRLSDALNYYAETDQRMTRAQAEAHCSANARGGVASILDAEFNDLVTAIIAKGQTNKWFWTSASLRPTTSTTDGLRNQATAFRFPPLTTPIVFSAANASPQPDYTYMDGWESLLCMVFAVTPTKQSALHVTLCSQANVYPLCKTA